MTGNKNKALAEYYERKNDRLKEALDAEEDAVERFRLRRAIRRNDAAVNWDGGPGSGNWGHSGRPGNRGGSAQGGGVINRLSTPSGGFTSRSQAEAEDRKRSKAAAKGGGGSGNNKSTPKNYDKEYGEFTGNMSKMQRGRAEKVLNAPVSYEGVPGVHSERQYVEYAVNNGLHVRSEDYVKPSVRKVELEGVPEQFKFAKMEEGLKEADYAGFVHGTLDTPLTKYFRKGDVSALTDRHKKTEYQVSEPGHDNIYQTISKTAFNYYEYLKGAK